MKWEILSSIVFMLLLTIGGVIICLGIDSRMGIDSRKKNKLITKGKGIKFSLFTLGSILLEITMLLQIFNYLFLIKNIYAAFVFGELMIYSIFILFVLIKHTSIKKIP